MDGKPLVAILLGSDSDLDIMKLACRKLIEFGIDYKISISSAHRTLEKTIQFVENSENDGVEVFICAAGMAAHLAGVVAGATVLPVIGVPMANGSLNGIDALYSTVQMPTGIPVATVAIGASANAAILAVQILSLKYPELKIKLRAFKQSMKEQVIEKDFKLQQSILDNKF